METTVANIIDASCSPCTGGRFRVDITVSREKRLIVLTGEFADRPLDGGNTTVQQLMSAFFDSEEARDTSPYNSVRVIMNDCDCAWLEIGAYCSFFCQVIRFRLGKKQEMPTLQDLSKKLDHLSELSSTLERAAEEATRILSRDGGSADDK